MSTLADGVFKPRAVAARDKAQHTNNVARSLLDEERTAREKKTARLRELRLAAEAGAPPPPAKKTPARKSRAKAKAPRKTARS